MLRCVYVDLDATLLGPGGSLLAGADGTTSLLAARAVEACTRAGVELCIATGRSRTTTAEVARLLGQDAYVFELGAAFSLRGEVHWGGGDWIPSEEATIHEQIAASGAPELLLAAFAGVLEPHEPWNRGRDVTHLLRGSVDVDAAQRLLDERGLSLRLVDNGPAHHASPDLRVALDELRCYHLLPAGASKATGVAAHQRARGYEPADCIGVGDSAEDLSIADVVQTFWLVANARTGADGRANVRHCEEGYGAGVYEAVMTTLAER